MYTFAGSYKYVSITAVIITRSCFSDFQLMHYVMFLLNFKVQFVQG